MSLSPLAVRALTVGEPGDPFPVPRPGPPDAGTPTLLPLGALRCRWTGS